MFKLIKNLKNKITGKSKKPTGPKPLAYISIWIRVMAMTATERDTAFSQGFILASRGRPGAELLTGHRLMDVISMVNNCVDIMNGDEKEGKKLAKETWNDHYMYEAEGGFTPALLVYGYEEE